MKRLPLLSLALAAVLLFSSCGTVSVPCDSIATLTQEGALYLCNVLSHQAPPAASLTASERTQAIGSINALQSIITSYRAAALAQAQAYVEAGTPEKAGPILRASAELAAQADTLRAVVKRYQGN